MTAYDNLTLSGNGGKRLRAHIIINGDLLVQNAAQLDAGTGPSYDVYLTGDWINNTNKRFKKQLGTVYLNGSSLQTIGNTTVGKWEDFHNLVIDNGGNSAALSSKIKITNDIQLVDGHLYLNADTLVLLDTAAMIVPTPGSSFFVTDGAGVIDMQLNAAGTYVFELGDSSLTYQPFTFDITSYTGTATSAIQINMQSGVHPNMVGSTYLAKYFSVNMVSVTAVDVDVTFNYTAADVIGTEADLMTTVWNGSGWVLYSAADTVAKTLGELNLTDLINNFDFTGGSAAVLPIELLTFTAQVEGREVFVDWATSSEINTNYFAVERSQDGNIFVVLDEVKAAGNSTTLRSYRSIDSEPLPGLSYYRLKSVDIDGSVEYTSWVTVEFEEETRLTQIYPNPVKIGQKISVILNSPHEVLDLYDMEGRHIQSETMQPGFEGEATNVNLKTSGLPPGMYLIVLNKNGLAKEKFKIMLYR